MYNILIIAGPSASGKTTVAKSLLDMEGSAFELELVRSLTTRGKRGDGFDAEYLYTTRDGFEKSLAEDGILEYTEYAEELYGTPRSEIERISESGRIPLLILDLNGVRSLSARKDILNPCTVYIYCDFELLRERLEARYLKGDFNKESKETFTKRIKRNVEDYKRILEYAPCFYALADNSKNLEITVNTVLSHLERFLSGMQKDEKANTAICESLKKSVEAIRF